MHQQYLNIEQHPRRYDDRRANASRERSEMDGEVLRSKIDSDNSNNIHIHNDNSSSSINYDDNKSVRSTSDIVSAAVAKLRASGLKQYIDSNDYAIGKNLRASLRKQSRGSHIKVSSRLTKPSQKGVASVTKDNNSSSYDDYSSNSSAEDVTSSSDANSNGSECFERSIDGESYECSTAVPCTNVDTKGIEDQHIHENKKNINIEQNNSQIL